MSDRHPDSIEKNIYFLEKQELSVNDFEAGGLILDIGGGGEGIIGRLKGEQVVAIDPNREELNEAASGPLKIVMDAGNLQFLDASFPTATSFFTLMYIDKAKHGQVFREIFRVLEPDGRFYIWEAVLPECRDTSKSMVGFHLLVKLPQEEIETGYAIRWPKQKLELAYYTKIAEQTGFIISEQKDEGGTFYAEYRKA